VGSLSSTMHEHDVQTTPLKLVFRPLTFCFCFVVLLLLLLLLWLLLWLFDTHGTPIKHK
jgi:hypothetical protein